MITHYYNTNTVEITETVENMVLRGDSEEDSEETEEDNEEQNEKLNYESKIYNDKEYENDINYHNTNEVEPKKEI